MRIEKRKNFRSFSLFTALLITWTFLGVGCAIVAIIYAPYVINDTNQKQVITPV
jgi:hypothetical protein